MNIKEKCINLLIDFLLNSQNQLSNYNWSSVDDFISADMEDAREKILEIADITDEKELEKLYEEIKKDYT